MIVPTKGSQSFVLRFPVSSTINISAPDYERSGPGSIFNVLSALSCTTNLFAIEAYFRNASLCITVTVCLLFHLKFI